MSTDDKDLQLGRLIRESKDADQDVAAIKAKLRKMSDSLMSGPGIINALGVVAGTTVESCIERIKTEMPEKSDVLATLAELKDAEARANGLRSQVRELGY